MPAPRIVLSTLGASAVFLLTAYSNPDSRATLSAQTAAKVGNPITGEGLPNPAPKVTRNWGELPAGRKWGTSAGVDIDPKDGHIWAYERCGAGAAGGPGGGGVRATPPSSIPSSSSTANRQGARELRQRLYGDAARHPRGPAGQRLDRGLRGKQGGHQGPPGSQVQPERRAPDEDRHRRQARQRPEASSTSPTTSSRRRTAASSWSDGHTARA